MHSTAKARERELEALHERRKSFSPHGDENGEF
jgi:hypothetical protein